MRPVPRGIDPELLEQVLAQEIGSNQAEVVFSAYDRAVEERAETVHIDDLERPDINAAQVFLTAMRGALDLPAPVVAAGQIHYGRDNTYARYLGKEADLSPYAHLLAAAKTPLLRLTDGDDHRAEELIWTVLNNRGWTVLRALQTLRAEWASYDAARAAEHDPVSLAVSSLLHHATLRGDFRPVRGALLAADLVWVCRAGDCDATQYIADNFCRQCGTGRDGQAADASTADDESGDPQV